MKFESTHLALAGLFILLASCGDSWLDEKSDKSLVVPTTIEDLQALLDNSYTMNEQKINLGESGSDDHYLTYTSWEADLPEQKNAYVWAEDIFVGLSSGNYQIPYQKIFYCNIVLEGTAAIDFSENNRAALNNIIGSAYYFRADGFYDLAQVFCKPFNIASADNDLGIPLRLNSDPNEPSVRASVSETYSQIIKDLTVAANLLPITPLFKTRPSKAAAFGLMARTYLMMEDYDKAKFYADSCLVLYNSLINYSELDTSLAFPVPFLNDEVIIHGKQLNALFGNNYFVDSLLYNSYDQADLRRVVFFRDNGLGGNNFVGSYIGPGNVTGNSFAGIATDEIYLIRAECHARNGDAANAILDLNTLLATRWKPGTFIPYTPTSGEAALKLVLTERRKELLFRGLRWSDLRRLNKDLRFAKTLTRVINGQTYTLSPEDPKYVYPIPDDVIEFTGMEQNPR